MNKLISFKTDGDIKSCWAASVDNGILVSIDLRYADPVDFDQSGENNIKSLYFYRKGKAYSGWLQLVHNLKTWDDYIMFSRQSKNNVLFYFVESKVIENNSSI